MSKQSVPEKQGAQRRGTRPAPSRALRGVELYREHAWEIRPMENGFWSVPSCRGRAPYAVDLETESCTCPDWRENRRSCKHVFAAAAAVARRGRATSGAVVEARARRVEELAQKIAEPTPEVPYSGYCVEAYNLFLAACALYPRDQVLVDAARKRHKEALGAHQRAGYPEGPGAGRSRGGRGRGATGGAA